MRIISEINVANFNFWAGAEKNANMLTHSELEELDDILSDMCVGIGETELNDMFWINFDEVCELLGYRYDIENDEIDRNPPF